LDHRIEVDKKKLRTRKSEERFLVKVVTPYTPPVL